jgi:xanthine dehydrogenase accessory factor
MKLAERARHLVMEGKPVAVVTIVDSKGSAPREQGATMLVTTAGFYGTIGGGALEWQAMAEAQRLLHQGAGTRTRHYALGPSLGQCCGGQVEVLTRVFDRNNIHELVDGPLERMRRIYLFGAGHVGRALVMVLAQSDVEVVWVDPRPGAFPAAVPSNVTLIEQADPAEVLATVPAPSFVFVMSHSHALDLAIVDAALRNSAIVEVGLIGSATKRARFEKRLAEAGLPENDIARLICPIGIGAIKSKKPAAIAISTAAQILALDEKHAAMTASDEMATMNQRTAS